MAIPVLSGFENSPRIQDLPGSPSFSGGDAGKGLVWDGSGWTKADLATQAELNTVAAAKQDADAELSAIAGLTSAANKLAYFTGSGTAALTDLTPAGRALIDDADADTQLTTLGVSTFIKTLLDDASAATARTTLGAQAQDAELDALAGLTSAADKLPYFTGSGAAALATLTSFARTLIDDADAATALTTLGVSTFIKTLLDDADAAAALVTLGARALAAEITELRHNANQSIANNTLSVVAFNTERRDVGGWHDNVTNNSRITVPRTGKYSIHAGLTWEGPSAPAGQRYMGFRLNGGGDTLLRAVRTNATAGGFIVTDQFITWEGHLAANDYVELYAYHTQGAALNIMSSDRSGYNDTPVFSARYLGS